MTGGADDHAMTGGADDHAMTGGADDHAMTGGADDHALRALAPDEVRAWRRPLAAAFLFVWQLAWGLLIASPWQAWAARSWGAFPGGDRALFQPGGYPLLAWLGGSPEALSVALRESLLLLVAALVLAQLPLGAALAQLAFARGGARRAPRAVTSLRAGASAFAPLLAISIFSGAVQLIVFGLFALGGTAVGGAFVHSLGGVPAALVRIAVTALGLVLVALVGVVADVARAAAVRDLGAVDPRGSAWSASARAVRTALRASRRGLGRAAVAWAWRAALGLLAIVAGALLASLVGVSSFGAVVALWLVHQAVVAARAALRASWLGRAVAIAASAE